MAMIASQSVHGAMVMATSVGTKQFLAPAKLRVRHRSPLRRRLSAVSAKHIGSYLDPTGGGQGAMEYRRMVFDHEDWIRHRNLLNAQQRRGGGGILM